MIGRTFRRATGLAFIAMGMLTAQAPAQEWPNRAINMIVAYGAGGGTDTIARQVGEPLSEILGQPVVIQNQPGAGGTIGAAAASQSEPDGYTLYMMAAGHSVAAAMYKTLPYNAADDFVGVSGIASMPLVMFTRPGSKIESVEDLVRLAKADPGGLTVVSVGIGSTQHLGAALIAAELGIELLEIPYAKTPEGIAAVMSGEVDMMVEVAAPVIGQIRAGDLQGIGVTSSARHPRLPDVGTFSEAGYTVEVSTWYGIAAPAKVDPAIIATASAAVAEALTSEALVTALENSGYVVAPTSPEVFTQTFRSDISRWQKVREAAGIEQN